MNNGKGNNKRNTSGKSNFGGKKPAFGKPGFKKEGFSKPKPDFERKPKAAKPKDSDEIRLNKYISNSGVCSRRDADIYIQSGNVKVNGEVVTEMGYKVKPGDVVNFDGTVITPEKKEYLLLNKPKGFTTSKEEDMNSNNVLDLVRNATRAKLQPVGRMDKTTTGLLLFTNDSDMIRKFTAPNQRSSKVYQVSLDKNLKFEDLERIASGLTIDNHRVFVEEVSYIEDQPKSEIGLKMKTSNVKVVRSIFEHLGYNVLKVDRVVFAGLTKKNLPRGNWRFLTEQEIINLRNI
ncbi:pseudouridine synthase [Flavobacterium suncheonense]|uniref:Pseudouridylate synthase n=1 Tax=Flavobacterium suncheonense GH29-5 = DSM 17707 TaxID=1121899 RepID=A0A0A2MCW1_9FLAO|nr:pseudouridine synthase [Flavobacterium suncheonense]KGO90522.1 pseudouridylate synthase [Flavobacterium suncheonense GH29-5 = DSM 17707]